MTQAAAARTPGAKRASPGEHLFELESLARVDRIKGGPDYSTAVGACIESERLSPQGNFEVKPEDRLIRLYPQHTQAVRKIPISLTSLLALLRPEAASAGPSFPAGCAGFCKIW